LVERQELMVLLTQRATQLRHHAGQVSFPGGRIEPGDASPEAAALREAQEEIGLDASFVAVIGYLPDHMVITGFRVTPVVAFVPLKFIFDPANHHPNRRRSPFTGEEVDFIDITYGEHNIWGATSGILMTLYRVCTAPELP
jgi:8-oxo-dGTP pyrophosphatase MutT (NUDIX family)